MDPSLDTPLYPPDPIPLPPDYLLDEWHRALGQRFGACDESWILRVRLIREETQELVDAIYQGQSLTNIAKEMADLVYVVYGLAYGLGVPLTNIVHLVHQNNMSKVREGIIVRREDGKILKPDDYIPVSEHEIQQAIDSVWLSAGAES